MSLEVFAVTPRIWCVRRPSYLTCSYVVKTQNGFVLVDAGMDSSGSDMVEGLRLAFGADVKEVRAILLSHWHNDHAAGAAAIHEASGAKVYYHAGDRPQLTRATAAQGARGALSARIPEWGPWVLFKGLLGEAVARGVEATELVSDGYWVAEDFEVIATPGHTPGHISFYYRPERALFAGDALAVVGGRIRFMAKPVTPDLPRAAESMQKCLDRPIDLLCPGHREPLTHNVSRQCAEMVESLRQGRRWPWLG